MPQASITQGNYTMNLQDFNPELIGGGSAVTIILAWLRFGRSFFSKDSVSRKGDRAEETMLVRMSKLLAESDSRFNEMVATNQKTIDDLDDRLKDALVRADKFAEERNVAIQMVGRLEGQIKVLTEEVERLRSAVEKSNAIQNDTPGV